MTENNAQDIEQIQELLTPDPWGNAEAKALQHTPYLEFFARPGSFNGGLYRGYCKNHPDKKYLTKGPGRSLHFVPDDPFADECQCPIADILIDPKQP